jgi:hypothetical protein
MKAIICYDYLGRVNTDGLQKQKCGKYIYTLKVDGKCYLQLVLTESEIMRMCSELVNILGEPK